MQRAEETERERLDRELAARTAASAAQLAQIEEQQKKIEAQARMLAQQEAQLAEQQRLQAAAAAAQVAGAFEQGPAAQPSPAAAHRQYSPALRPPLALLLCRPCQTGSPAHVRCLCSLAQNPYESALLT